MKFAKELEQSLKRDEMPEEWVEAAIQYKALKKCIGKVVKELNTVGLERDTLKLILENIEINEHDTTASNPIVAKYVLKKSKNHHEIVPNLKLIIDYNENISEKDINESIALLKKKLDSIVNGTTSESEMDDNINQFNSIDETIADDNNSDTSTIKSFTESDRSRGSNEFNINNNNNNEEDETKTIKQPKSELLSPTTSIDRVPGDKKKFQITIKLKNDAKFFHMLNEELRALDNLRIKEENKLIEDVKLVSDTINQLSGIDSIKKSDIYKWREVFKMFIDSEIYFRTNNVEVKTFQNSSEKVADRLEEFKKNVESTKILTTFKNKKSLGTFNRFLEINENLLKVLKFQSINSRALTKILKKFDKRTSLGVKLTVPDMITPDHIFMNGSSIAKTICSVIQTNILPIIPQLDDYMCPICADIAYKPIRLSCNHIFCVRCMVKQMGSGHDECPLCKRENAVSEADSSNIDNELALKMIKFFPDETKAKLRDRQKERYSEFRGDNNGKCNIV